MVVVVVEGGPAEALVAVRLDCAGTLKEGLTGPDRQGSPWVPSAPKVGSHCNTSVVRTPQTGAIYLGLAGERTPPRHI